MRTVGVEEELLLVDGLTGRPLPVGTDVQRRAIDERLTTEFKLEQTEIAAGPHVMMETLAADILRCRSNADAAARAAGARTVALATSPLPVTSHSTPGERYAAMMERFGITTREQLTCGCHVHVSVDSDDEAIGVLDRIGMWLPVLTALSANSPYWQGTDTGYASFRSQVWNRLPVTGPNDIFGSANAYHRRVSDLLATGVPIDEGMIYFDARLSRAHPTVEIRVADVCLEAGSTVLIAALTRGLVETAARQWQAGGAAGTVPADVLRLAGWRASKSGIDGELLNPLDHRPCEAATAIEALVDYIRPALAETGDQDRVEHLLEQVLDRGNGARRQRAAFSRRNSLCDVVTEGIRLSNTHTNDVKSHLWLG